MAASGRVSIQDGGQGNVKMHPYFAALIRWCISSIWTTATVLLHRLMTAPVQPITGPKPPKPRPASSEHLHPEPLVECVVLHQPHTHTLDVIFVHGLYGSLGNTWRQGEWRVNYKSDPIKVPLRRPHSIPTACACNWDRDERPTEKCQCDFLNESKSNKIDYDTIDDDEMYEKYRKVLPKDDLFITEKFYNNTLLDKVEIDNFDTQASFVRDLFEKNCESEVRKLNCQCQSDRCLGCGCTCDVCYSPCWPRDWIKIDYPGARVISINYTSDPYLWRPLWIKESKRQRLHERAEQMMLQLLSLGVGEKPIIWVGHSKGGLFIKEIYCKAYEAYLKTNETNANEKITDKFTENNIQDVPNGNIQKDIENNNLIKENVANEAKLTNLINYVFRIQNKHLDNKLQTIRIDEQTENKTIIEENVTNEAKDISTVSSNNKEDPQEVNRANLWRNSVGFMFYSVPHRGSPLADIKTPITARSIELLEICKECSLVMDLQDRWLKATEFSKPAVNSLVETCKTLMSLLWLRIVSVDSADPGIGALSGVSVDHREICKPSSRNCLLYRELKILIQNALNINQLKNHIHNKN